MVSSTATKQLTTAPIQVMNVILNRLTDLNRNHPSLRRAALSSRCSAIPRRFGCLWARFAVLALLYPGLSAQAANVYWTGATDSNWTSAGNWTGTVSGNTVVYDSHANNNFIQTL